MRTPVGRSLVRRIAQLRFNGRGTFTHDLDLELLGIENKTRRAAVRRHARQRKLIHVFLRSGALPCLGVSVLVILGFFDSSLGYAEGLFQEPRCFLAIGSLETHRVDGDASGWGDDDFNGWFAFHRLEMTSLMAPSFCC